MALHRFRVKNKGKKWKKGESSSTNPSYSKFREIAKLKSTNIQRIKNPHFTKENLEKHDQHVQDKDFPIDVEDDQRSNATDITTWTNCSNTSFDIVFQKNLLNSQIHREILALLATITEIIQSKGGIESDSEYLASFLTALNSLHEKESVTAAVYLIKLTLKKIPHQVLVCKYHDICGILLRTLAKFENATSSSLLFNSIFISLALILRDQPTITLLEPFTIKVFDTLLFYTLDERFKVRKSANKAINLVLFTATSGNQDRDDIRNTPPTLNPLIKEVFQFCQLHITKCFDGYNNSRTALDNHKDLHTNNKSGEKTNGGNNKDSINEELVNDSLHCLTLLKDCYVKAPNQLPAIFVKTTFETTFKMMTHLHEKNVRPICMKVLGDMLGSSYQESPQLLESHLNDHKALELAVITPRGNLDTELNAKVLSALYDLYEGEGGEKVRSRFQGSASDNLQLWMSALTRGVLSLAARDRTVCASHFVRTFHILLKYSSGGPDPSHSSGSAHACENLLHLMQTVLPALGCYGNADTPSPATRGYVDTDGPLFSSKNILASLSKGLEKVLVSHRSLEHVTGLDNILGLLGTFIKTTGLPSLPHLGHVIKSLAKLKDDLGQVRDSSSLQAAAVEVSESFKSALDAVLATLVSVYGPENVLKVIPLGIDPDGLSFDLKRSWLIPTLRDNMGRECRLAHYMSYFLPLATRLRAKASEQASSGNAVLSKTMETLYYQLWSLLPGFAAHSDDLTDVDTDPLRQFLPCMLGILTNAAAPAQITEFVLRALRNFVTKNPIFSNSFVASVNAPDLDFYYRTVLPALYNCYARSYQNAALSSTTGRKDPLKLLTYETIKSTLVTCPAPFLTTFFSKLRQKLEVGAGTASGNAGTDPKYPAWLDLASAFLPHLRLGEGSDRLDVGYTAGDDETFGFVLDFALRGVGLPRAQTTRTVQKKCYKILEEVLINMNEFPEWRRYYLSLTYPKPASLVVGQNDGATRLDAAIAPYLVELCDVTHPSSLAYRFRCLTTLANLNLTINASPKSNIGDLNVDISPILNASLTEALCATHDCGIKAKEAALNFLEVLISNQTSPWLLPLSPSTTQNGVKAIRFETMDDFMGAILERVIKVSEYSASDGEVDMAEVDLSDSITPPLDMDLDFDDVADDGLTQTEKSGKKRDRKNSDLELKRRIGALTVLNHFFVCSEIFEENHMHISDGAKGKIVAAMIGLLTSQHRAIVKHSLDFFCTGMAHIPKSMVIQYTAQIVSQFGRMRRNFKKPLRFKIKLILTKLCRKGNPDTVRAFLPREFGSMLEAVQKVERRKDKKRRSILKNGNGAEGEGGESESGGQSFGSSLARAVKSNDIRDVLKDMDTSEDDYDSEDHVIKAVGSRDRKETKVYIEEGDPSTDKIMDLLDPSDSTKILVTRKNMDKSSSGQNIKSISRPSRSNFPIAADGRLVISDEGKSDKTLKGSVFDENESFDVEDDDGDEVTTVFGRKVRSEGKVRGMKRKGGDGTKLSFDVDKGKRVRFAPATASSSDPTSSSAKLTKGVQPFAYYPLDKQMLSKRKRAKLDSKLKGIVGSARKGALAGNKSRLKSRNRR